MWVNGDEGCALASLGTRVCWLKVSEVIDYVMAVKPEVAIPVHDAVLAMPGMHIGIVQKFAPAEETEIRVLENGSTTEV